MCRGQRCAPHEFGSARRPFASRGPPESAPVGLAVGGPRHDFESLHLAASSAPTFASFHLAASRVTRSGSVRFAAIGVLNDFDDLHLAASGGEGGGTRWNVFAA
jgi:hypothetical protein